MLAHVLIEQISIVQVYVSDVGDRAVNIQIFALILENPGRIKVET